ncbi:MAG: hypothetical protein ACYS8W_12595 [Planctomycetota bacterium]|jgi:hypothetical protein
MKSPIFRKIVFAVPFILVVLIISGCERADTGALEKNIANLEKQLVDANARIKELENRLGEMETARAANDNAIRSLSSQLAELEKGLEKSAVVGVAPNVASAGAEKAADAGAVKNETEKGKADIFTALKKAIKTELKAEDAAKQAEKRKKQSEQNKEWARKDYERRMSGFGKFAEEIGLSGSIETDIRVVAEETFKRVLDILTDAWNKPPEEVDWGKVQEKIQETYKEAEDQIAPYVTEEQGEKLKEYFGMNR